MMFWKTALSILILTLTGCATEPLRFTPEELPPIDSSTATQPLMVNSIALLTQQDREYVEENYKHTHTFEAYKKLIRREVDIILSLEPNEELKAMAAEQGVQFEIEAIGKDAFVFIVNRQNPVTGLTLDQIRSIYAGKITRWSEVGGPDSAIIPFQREHESGSQAIMENVVMAGLEMLEAPSEEINTGMGFMNERMSYDNSADAIGYNIYYFTTYMHPDENIRMLAVNGVEPNKENIQSGDYPITGEIFAIIRSDEAPDSPARRMMDWYQTAEGQQVVEESGYVPVISYEKGR